MNTKIRDHAFPSRIRESRLILGNTLNELTHRDLTPEVASFMDLSAFQELWLIEPGDVFVTPRPLPHGFRAMVCRILDLETNCFTCLSPDAALDESLLSALGRTGMLSQLQALAVSRPAMKIRACALDEPLLRLSRKLNLQIEGYRRQPSESLLATIYRLNTKSGFREIASSLGLHIPPGVSDVKASDVEGAVRQILVDHDEVIVKCDRGSGGGGQFRISQRSALCDPSVVRKLHLFLEGKADLGQTFVVEACLPLRLDPTIDVKIADDGHSSLHVGAMQCIGGAFQGMRVPAQSLTGKPLADLHLAADRIGEYLFACGYRGFFDIDAGLTESGDLYLFETNVRRTSTSLWDEVLTRLFGSELGEKVVWKLTTERLPRSYDFDSLSSLGAKQSSGASNGQPRTAALMTWAFSDQQSFLLSLNAGTTWCDVIALEAAQSNISLSAV